MAAERFSGGRRLKGVGLGAGYFAPFQYEAWTRIPEVEIAAIYNRTEDRAAPSERIRRRSSDERDNHSGSSKPRAST